MEDSIKRGLGEMEVVVRDGLMSFRIRTSG
jgi:hypothetical protein